MVPVPRLEEFIFIHSLANYKQNSKAPFDQKVFSLLQKSKLAFTEISKTPIECLSFTHKPKWTNSKAGDEYDWHTRD